MVNAQGGTDLPLRAPLQVQIRHLLTAFIDADLVVFVDHLLSPWCMY
jgi:hypothetical protein